VCHRLLVHVVIQLTQPMRQELNIFILRYVNTVIQVTEPEHVVELAHDFQLLLPHSAATLTQHLIQIAVALLGLALVRG
jgi:hypothetical protein